jgi:hypothetical protein
MFSSQCYSFGEQRRRTRVSLHSSREKLQHALPQPKTATCTPPAKNCNIGCRYQASSPDEIALVKYAEACGVQLVIHNILPKILEQRIGFITLVQVQRDAQSMTVRICRNHQITTLNPLQHARCVFAVAIAPFTYWLPSLSPAKQNAWA